MIEKIIKVADTYVLENKPQKASWSWGEALLMYSLSLLDDYLGKDRYLNYYKTYADHHYNIGYIVDQADTCAPALVTNELYKKTGDIKYKKMTIEGINYLKYEPRLFEDLINHNGHSKDSRDYPKSIWVDSVMMSGVFSAIASKDYKDEALRKYALSQPRQYAKYLQDPVTKLFHHSYWKILNRVYPRNIFWGRGNGWVVAAYSIFLNYMNDSGTRRILNEISSTLLSFQRIDGYFDTVLNKPNDNYRESSATCLIAAGWINGVLKGHLNKKYLLPAIKALQSVVSNLRYDKDKVYMTEISKWTIPMFIMPYRLRFGPYPGYKYVKKGENINYGVASLILAGIFYGEYERTSSKLCIEEG